MSLSLTTFNFYLKVFINSNLNYITYSFGLKITWFLNYFTSYILTLKELNSTKSTVEHFFSE